MRADVERMLSQGWQPWEVAEATGLDVAAVERMLASPPAGTGTAFDAEQDVNDPDRKSGAGARAESDRSAERSSRAALRSLSALSAPAQEPWPTLAPEALHGIAGKVVETLKPQTEADPAGLLLGFLAGAGSILDARTYAMAEAMPHPGRLNVVLVGKTSRARKGSAWARVRRVLDGADPDWAAGCILTGLASGEALVDEVRDDPDADQELSSIRPERRRLIVESEFARLLAVASRDGSTLSAVLRDAWDGLTLRNRTKRNQLTATGAHISLLAMITREELHRTLTTTEAVNGFANRCLFALVRRSKLLPEGGQLDPAVLDHLADQVQAALRDASDLGALDRSETAKDVWAAAYNDFGEGEDGLAGAVTARAEAQALRLQVLYAALDGSKLIEPEHVRAALAVWGYCEQSAYLIFGDATGDPVADQLLTALRAAGAEGLDGTAQRDLFSRHASRARLDLARKVLEDKGLIVTTSEPTGGRPRLVSRAVVKEHGDG